MSEEKQKCSWCKRDSSLLKMGWNGGDFCSERCERTGISFLHSTMPGNVQPYIGYLPHHISLEISRRWAK
jgi:hypothetical protein